MEPSGVEPEVAAAGPRKPALAEVEAEEQGIPAASRWALLSGVARRPDRR